MEICYEELLISLFIALSLISGYSFSEDIKVISKQTVGLDHKYDYKARIFRLCIGGHEFIQSFAVCPMEGSVDSSIIQVYGSVDIELNGKTERVTVPKECDR